MKKKNKGILYFAILFIIREFNLQIHSTHDCPSSSWNDIFDTQTHKELPIGSLPSPVSCLLSLFSFSRILPHVSFVMHPVLSHVSCLMSPVAHLLSHISYLTSLAFCLTSPIYSTIPCLLSEFSHISCLVCLTSPLL